MSYELVIAFIDSADRVVIVRSGSSAAFVNVFKSDTNPSTETSAVNNDTGT